MYKCNSSHTDTRRHMAKIIMIKKNFYLVYWFLIVVIYQIIAFGVMRCAIKCVYLFCKAFLHAIIFKNILSIAFVYSYQPYKYINNINIYAYEIWGIIIIYHAWYSLVRYITGIISHAMPCYAMTVTMCRHPYYFISSVSIIPLSFLPLLMRPICLIHCKTAWWC